MTADEEGPRRRGRRAAFLSHPGWACIGGIVAVLGIVLALVFGKVRVKKAQCRPARMF
ncbi:hypothetical protein ACFV2S_04270 [Streptomyces sp. NPDC059695]|uniref:hypothetical protein n=1 Tax=Streptomyces sp. NPDC059695 TaxID=3346910 RepID=UPI0036915362